MSKRKKEKKKSFFVVVVVAGDWRQQFLVTEAFKQIELKTCNKMLYFSKLNRRYVMRCTV